MSVVNRLERESIIKQLNEFGVRKIDGQALEDVQYTTLLRTLAVKRAAQE